MDNEEIMRRIKIHSTMFDKYEDIIDKDIVILARRYMELFFFELMKHNIINDESPKSKL